MTHKMNVSAFCMLVLAVLLSVLPSYADNNDLSEVIVPSWPRIIFIEDGATWELTVYPAGSDKPLSVVQTLNGTEIINDKQYMKLMSSVDGGESEVISYLYIDGTDRRIWALDPNNIERGERLIYAFMRGGNMTAAINWKGEMSECDYYVYPQTYHWTDFKVENRCEYLRLVKYNVYSVDENDQRTLIGDVEWIEGLGNVTGLLNQLYCVDNSDKVILTKMHSTCDGLIYDAALADVEQIDVNEEKTVVAIFNIRGMQIQDFEPGLNIVRYSDGSVEKVMK